jgi:hypothetical protein
MFKPIFVVIKGTCKLIFCFKKTFLIVVILLGSVGYYYLHEYQKTNLAIAECQNLYLKQINNFSELTGIVGLNVSFTKPPIINHARNIYALRWDKTINVAGQLDSFKCQYNFATNKALNRSDDATKNN